MLFLTIASSYNNNIILLLVGWICFPLFILMGAVKQHSIRDTLTSQTTQSIIIGLPMRAMPNRKMEAALSVQQKDKMVDRTPRRLCMSHSNFRRKGVGHFRRQVQKSDWINSDRQSGSDQLGSTRTNSDLIKK